MRKILALAMLISSLLPAESAEALAAIDADGEPQGGVDAERTTMTRFVLALLLLIPGPATTRVSDTIYYADGSTPANGSLHISWDLFTSPDGYQIAAGSKNVKIVNGAFASPLYLVPSVGAVDPPAGAHYTVAYALANGDSRTPEKWCVPAPPGPVTIYTLQHNCQ